VRKRRFDVDELVALMPEKKLLIEAAVFDKLSSWQFDVGSQATHNSDLAYAAHLERITNIDTIEWRDADRKRATLFEVWYRQWMRGKVLELPNGSIVKFDPRDPRHAMAVAGGFIKPQVRTYSDIRVAFFLGCHRLYDMPTPYPHRFFPYVPFFGYKEDSSGIRYGMIRNMISPQDVVNSADAKMHHILNSRMLIANSDAIDLKFNSWRQVQDQLSTPKPLILLDPNKPNTKFDVKSDFELNAQQFNRRMQAANDIESAGGIFKASMGKEGAATSGIGINSLIEQTGVMMAEINDNASFGRRQVGEMLFSLQLEDMGRKETKVAIKAHGKKSIVVLNQRVQYENGSDVIENDVTSVKAKVTLTDIPTTASFKAQQLSILSEVAKSLPPEMQAVFVPAMILLSDAPDKDELAEEIRKIAGLGPKLSDEEQAAADAQNAQNAQDLATLEKRTADANVRLLETKVEQLIRQNEKTDAQTVAEMVKAIYAAMQAGQVIATVPHVAPIADELLRAAKFPEIDVPDIPAELQVHPEASTTYTPLPASPFIGEQAGIETMRGDGVQPIMEGEA
jgi:hypothetical protein